MNEPNGKDNLSQETQAEAEISDAESDEREKALFVILDKESAPLRSAAKAAYEQLSPISDPIPEISNILQGLKSMETVEIENIDEAIGLVSDSYEAFAQRADSQPNLIKPDVYAVIIKGMADVGKEVLIFSTIMEEINDLE